MTLDPHTTILAITTVFVGYFMTVAGLQKSVLEWRRRRRVCPSCGRHIESRVCSGCA
jgi:NADH pyrophosphatase NudC (nudix superfamily)